VIYLLSEIWACLAVSLLIGLLSGWILWGLSLSRIEGTLRFRLSQARKNWGEVEALLADASIRLSILEQERTALERVWSLREQEWEAEKKRSQG
jgi:hypothetical protein